MPQNSIAMMQNFPHEIEHDSTFLFTSESVGEGHPGKCLHRVYKQVLLSDNGVRGCHQLISHNMPLISTAKLYQTDANVSRQNWYYEFLIQLDKKSMLPPVLELASVLQLSTVLLRR